VSQSTVFGGGVERNAALERQRTQVLSAQLTVEDGTPQVEVFQHAVENTPGDDLHKVLWLKSSSSEVWLNRRTNYTRSLAMMSMVGYLLGLGDRHPSNLMLDRYSGKILHIDFGDCFEASMNREKYPEKVSAAGLTRHFSGGGALTGNHSLTSSDLLAP
jgi:phosphatidylinositol kinase/protein kinase (PI-3  family)